MRARITTTVVATAVAATALAALAVGAAASTGPATPTQLAADVASSVSITTLPANLTPSLQTASRDTAYVDTPTLAKCNTTGTNLTPSKCVFGDPKGTKTMVLWGDSHAFMWFPAVNAVAKAAHWRLIALLELGCPVATVSVWDPLTKTPYKVCDLFRANMITKIDKLNPSLVVMSEAFTSQAANAGGAGNTITTQQWQAGLTTTLKALHSKAMKKLLLGSTVSSGLVPAPAACLSVNASTVQKCTVKDTAAQQAQRAAEVAAAKATSTSYVDVLPWECTSSTTPASCSSIVGDATSGYKIVYYSTGHFTETYDLFLTTVLRNALKPHMH